MFTFRFSWLKLDSKTDVVCTHYKNVAVWLALSLKPGLNLGDVCLLEENKHYCRIKALITIELLQPCGVNQIINSQYWAALPAKDDSWLPLLEVVFLIFESRSVLIRNEWLCESSERIRSAALMNLISASICSISSTEIEEDTLVVHWLMKSRKWGETRALSLSKAFQ